MSLQKMINETESKIKARNGHDQKDPQEKYSSLKDFEPYRITETTPIPEPLPVVTIDGQIICTAADLTAISGPSKTGKTGFTQPILASSITVDSVINDPIEFLSVEPNKERKAVIHIDTEQARWKHQRNVKAILGRAKLLACPDHFLSYNIRQLALQEYEPLTLAICNHANRQFSGVHLIVIDGIADYVQDVNDAAQANAIVKTFEELAIKYNCPIITIIHVNPGSDKERGHLGSQCQRKAGSVLTVKKDGDTSYLEPKFLRYAGSSDLPVIQFQYDKDKGYHVSAGTRTTGTNERDAARMLKLKDLAKQSFPPPGGYEYGDGIERIMRAAQRQEKTAKGFFTEMKVHGFITQESKLWRLNIEAVQL